MIRTIATNGPRTAPTLGILLVLLAVVAGASGCIPSVIGDRFADIELDKKGEKSPLPGRPKFEVAGQSLGDGQELSVSADVLIARVGELLDGHHTGYAARWVERFPEAALETLRGAGGLPVSNELLTFVARVHGRQSMSASASGAWNDLIARRIQHPDAFRNFDNGRKQLRKLLADGHVDAALELNLPQLAQQTQSPLIMIDAQQIQGTVWLLKDKPTEALRVWQAALESVDGLSSYQTTYLLLLMSDAYRRANDAATAQAIWQRATETAIRDLAARQLPIRDPVLWERLSYLRPNGENWPAAAVDALQLIAPIRFETGPRSSASPAARPVPLPGEVAVWHAIGTWYLDRSQTQAALLAFKRAESAATEPQLQALLRVRQARALAQLDQIGAATAILTRLAADAKAHPLPEALALLGSLRLQSGQIQSGLHLLRRAVEQHEHHMWPERHEAEADLGLAYLMAGDEKKGTDWLHRARNEWQAERHYESLALCLENEAKYWESVEQPAKSAALREQLDQWERAIQL